MLGHSSISCFDRIIFALVSYLRSELKQDPRYRQHRQRQEAKQTRRPCNAKSVIHCTPYVSRGF